MGIKEEECSKYVIKSYFIHKRINEIGISKKYIAYYYIADILDMLINENRIIKSYSKEVYPDLARKYSKNGCTVERDIRNLINIYWDSTFKFKLIEFSGPNKPTCMKFIKILKNYLIYSIS